MRALAVELATTPELRAFRDELRGWLVTHLTDELRAPALSDPTGASGESFQRRRAWQQRLYDGGWAGVHWPKEHGGRSASLWEYAIYLVECAAAGAPEPVNVIGINMAGPTLIAHGTETQRSYLPGILSAEHIWCQLFSEPDAGSDLGAIACRARPRPGGGWVVDGQKVWTSWGAVADYGLLLARTGGTGFRGLSCFILPMHSAGVTVRGLRQMSGETHFSEVFLDGVALDADALIGPEGEGWPVASTTLVHERTTAILSRHATTLAAASALLDLGSGAAPAQRDAAVALWIEAQLLRLSGYRGVAEAHAGQPSAASYIQRLQWGLLNRRIFELGVNLTGCFEDHVWTTLFLTSRGWTIGGGTSEIQRNMLAEKVLGLPRR